MEQALAALRHFETAYVRLGSKPAYMRFSIWVRFAIRTGHAEYLDYGYGLSDLLVARQRSRDLHIVLDYHTKIMYIFLA